MEYFAAAQANVQKGLEFFAEAGIRCPSASVMQELVGRIEKFRVF